MAQTRADYWRDKFEKLQTSYEQVVYERDEWRRQAEARDDAETFELAATKLGLTRKEREFLHRLWVSRAIKSWAQLADEVYGNDGKEHFTVVKVIIMRLRDKLGTNAAIDTHWGQGYILSDRGRWLISRAAQTLAEAA